MNRKEFLLSEIKENPSDPLNYYMLALEYKKEGEETLCKALFNQLIDQHERYLPTYYTYGSYLIELAEEEKAEDVLQKGKILALEAGHEKMAKEIQSLIDFYC